MCEICGQMNYWAVLVSAAVYWLCGMLWFSVMIGKNWSIEMKKHGIQISKPKPSKMAEKSIWTFVLNLIVAFGVALLVNSLAIHTLGAAIGLALVLAICFVAAVMATSYLWENRSFKLSFYDIFYPFIGVVISTIIIALWR